MARLYSSLLLSLVIGAWPSWSHATPLPIGAEIAVPGEPDPVGGTLLVSSGPVPFSGVLNSFSGTLTSAVYSNDSTNPAGPSAFTFTYLLTNNPTSLGSIYAISLFDWGVFNGVSYTSDVSYQIPTTETPPSRALRYNESVLNFFFQQPGVMPGQTSALLVVQSNATTYGAHYTQIEAAADSAYVTTFAPVPVPEPSTCLLVIVGLLGLAGWRRARA